MNSRFYYRMTYRGNGITVPVTIDAPFVTNLSAKIRQVASLVVLADDEGNASQGLHLWVQDRWRLALPQVDVSLGVVVGYDIDIYYELLNPMPVPAGTFVFRNGQRFTGSTMTADSQFIWVVMTPAAGSGTVKSVNSQSPDANGNVEVNIADIPGLQQALADAGQVKTVNAIAPDANGNITLAAADVGAVSLTVVGQPNGVTSLDSNGWVPMSQLPPGIIGGLQYQSAYDADTNTPPLPAPDQANKGWYWVVSEAGTQQGLDLRIGDWIVSNGTSYDKIDNQEGRVLSVNGAMPDAGTGNVVVPFATSAVAGTVYVPPAGGLLIGADGALTVNTAQIGSWTPSDTVWVDYNGEVSGTGAVNNPFRTIGEAIDNAAANAVIMISPGSFAENLVLGSKPLYIKGWGNVGNYARTVITGNMVVGGANQIRVQDLGINYNGTQPCLSVTSVGTTAGFKFENIVINANNTQTALQTDASAGAWTGSAYFVSLYVNAGKINHAAGTGYVTTRMFPQDSTSTLEVHGGTIDLTEVWHLNSILHTAGTLQLFRARSIGTDPGVAAIVSTADNSPGNFLLMHKVSTWITAASQSFVSKTGNCPYVIDGLTRNLVNDVFNGIMVPLKTEQDQDTVVSWTGVNYVGTRGAMLNTHLTGIDNALGARLSQITSVGTGVSLVAVPTSGSLKSVVQGAGIQVTSDANTVTVANVGVLALSSVAGAGVTSLVNTTSGQLKSVIGAGGMTITESGGVITFTSSQAATGVSSLNGLVNAVILDALDPLVLTPNGQTLGLTYIGLRSLNGVVGAGNVIEGLGIDVNTVGQNITVTNTGVHYLRVTGTDFTEGVTLAAGTNVTLDKDTSTNTITINSTGGGGTAGVASLNTLTGALTITQGPGITVSAMGSAIQISATGAANPVSSLNTLTGNLNLIGEGGINVNAQGADTLIVTYDGGASVSVTELNGKTGALSLLPGAGVAIDNSVAGQITVSAPPTGVQSVVTAPGAPVGSYSLVLEGGAGGSAVIANLIPSSSVSFVSTPEGVQLIATGGGGGSGSVTSVAGIAPDVTGDVPLTAGDLGALTADGTVPFTANLDAANFTIDNVADPTAPQQPVTLAFLEALIIDQGLVT